MRLLPVIFVLLLSGCNDGSENFAEKEYNVYFLGNSITRSSPNEEFGWYGNWGMAATSAENDYVHKLIAKMEKEYKDRLKINYGIKNISNWEVDFFAELDPLEMNEIDLLIIRLGENVNEEYAKNNNYYAALDKMIKKFKGNNTKVIITDTYWISAYKDHTQKKVAIDNYYYFVQINDLYQYPENSAFGQFEHYGVSMHPSDTGMEKIAQKIFECIIRNRIIE